MFHLRKSRTIKPTTPKMQIKLRAVNSKKKHFWIEAKDAEMKNTFREIIQPLYLHESFQSFVFLIIWITNFFSIIIIIYATVYQYIATIFYHKTVTMVLPWGHQSQNLFLKFHDCYKYSIFIRVCVFVLKLHKISLLRLCYLFGHLFTLLEICSERLKTQSTCKSINSMKHSVTSCMQHFVRL